mmetsp:Transcript_3439/g.7754  ORF Transcript_3439/g.7754 Transcript_3439/m.7754 type:complete len:237 (+) Transcript_3439:155-865(+)
MLITCDWLSQSASCTPLRALGKAASECSPGALPPKNMFHNPPLPWGVEGAGSPAAGTAPCPRRGFSGDIANSPDSPPASREPVSSSPLPIFSGETPRSESWGRLASTVCDGLTWKRSCKSEACSLLVASLASPSSKSWSDSGILVSTSILTSNGPAPFKPSDSPACSTLPTCPADPDPSSINPAPLGSTRRELRGGVLRALCPEASVLSGAAERADGNANRPDDAASRSLLPGPSL